MPVFICMNRFRSCDAPPHTRRVRVGSQDNPRDWMHWWQWWTNWEVRRQVAVHTLSHMFICVMCCMPMCYMHICCMRMCCMRMFCMRRTYGCSQTFFCRGERRGTQKGESAESVLDQTLPPQDAQKRPSKATRTLACSIALPNPLQTGALETDE